MTRSSGFRFAALYAALFVLSGVIMASAILASAHFALSRDFDRRIIAETDALAEEFRREGVDDVQDAIRERDEIPDAMAYGLTAASGAPIVGSLGRVPRPLGWSEAQIEGKHIRLYTERMPSGEKLSVGDDLGHIEGLDAIILRSFAGALIISVLIGGISGLVLGRRLHLRLSAISATAHAIAEGDMSRRAPLQASGDDLDQMAQAFNQMLDRVAELMESLRQVSHDVAHDLRTPLARLRQKLETGSANTNRAEQAQLIESAMGDLDAILETFAAILRIAQVEGGARRAAFAQIDLTQIAGNVVEAFAPSAEEECRTLTLIASQPVGIVGDSELLTQALANLVENALRHTPPGSQIKVAVTREQGWAILSVTDNGPGVPAAERTRVLDRFYRLESSRTTPGSGLGLSLVQAIVRLHGGQIALLDAAPGLKVRITLPVEN